MNTRTTQFNGHKVVILDGAIQADQIERADALARSLPFHRIKYGYRPAPDATPKHDHMWAHLVTPEERTQLPLDTIVQTAREHFGDGLTVSRTHINCIQAGERRHAHIDSPDANIIVAVTMLNAEWDRDWHGELTFFREGEADLSVAPMPGRIVMFPGCILHRGGVPISSCPEARYALVQKLLVEA